MEEFIRSRVLTVEKVYSGIFRLELPWFQRAYAWGEMHVGSLVRDVVKAMSGPNRRYSIGHISLARALDGREAAIVDGHQRSITLTILFALLRDQLAGRPIADRLHLLIADERGGYRLSPQPSVADFMSTYVQSPGATRREVEGDIMDCSPNERNILANRDHMAQMLEGLAPDLDKREDLARFLLERCVIIVNEVEDQDEAWALLTREEERGLSPHSSELAKVTMLTALKPEERDEAARLYERAQTLLSKDDLSNLMSHIRTLRLRTRSTRPVDRELVQSFNLQDRGISFFTSELVPRAETMARIIARDVGDGPSRAETARSLEMLSWLDHQLWMPAAMHWIAVKGGWHAETALYFARLDRLSYALKIASIDPTEQEGRYLKLLSDIDAGQPVERMPSLDIEPKLMTTMLANLRSKTFYAKRFHALVLRRISCILDPTCDPGPVDGQKVTVEHVLPRKPEDGQQWFKDFEGPQGVAEFCNRIGNLAFLSLANNNIAGNKSFMVKRLLLAQSASQFVLSKLASNEEEWTPRTIERRSEEMIATLLAPWGLTS